jgi:hypothetical protein
MYRLKLEECERGRAGKAKESPDCEHLGTQKEPTQVAQREEWGNNTVFTCLNSGGNAARALFLVRIEEQWSVNSEQWTENKQGSEILTTVH